MRLWPFPQELRSWATWTFHAAFCGLSNPFAKRTWAVGLSASRYLQFVVVGTAMIAG